ncbi:MAG: hypothetical protein NTW78_12925 [Campylobacterales bacterium]|nr:hypothetical protein [Campylobacterales bacterium]
MSKIEKIKRLVLVVLGFGLSAYLMYSGVAILSQEDKNSSKAESTK